MSASESVQIVKTPWYYWLICILALLWNSMGALDYVMTQTANEAYLSGFSAEQLAFFNSFPSWVVFAWAVAVWGSVAGSLLLLLRKSLAVWFFLVSLIAMVVTTFHNYILSNGMQVVGDTFSLTFTAVIFIIALALYLYSRSVKQKGILV